MSSKRKYVLGFHNCIDGFYAAYQTYIYFDYLKRNSDDKLVLVPLDYPLHAGQYEEIRKYAAPGNYFCLVDYALSSERLIRLSKSYDKVTFVDHHPKGFRIKASLESVAQNLIEEGRLNNHVYKDRCGSRIFNDEIIIPRLLEMNPTLASLPRPSLHYIDILDRGLVDRPNYDQISCYMGTNIDMDNLYASFQAFARIDAENDQAKVIAEGQKIIDEHRPRHKAIQLLKNHYCIWLEGLDGFKNDWYDIVFSNILHPIYGRPLADKACKLSRYQKNGAFFIGHIRSDGKFHLSIRTWKGMPKSSTITIRGNGHKAYKIDDLSLAPDAGELARCFAKAARCLIGGNANGDSPEGDGHAGRGCVQFEPTFFAFNYFVATQEFARTHPEGPSTLDWRENILNQVTSPIAQPTMGHCHTLQPISVFPQPLPT